MKDVKVGALVEVTLRGKVLGTSESRGLYVETGEAGIDAFAYWVPTGARVEVLRPARPREVLLLECGHVMDSARPTSTTGTAYCWRAPCHTNKVVVGVGSVQW